MDIDEAIPESEAMAVDVEQAPQEPRRCGPFHALPESSLQ